MVELVCTSRVMCAILRWTSMCHLLCLGRHFHAAGNHTRDIWTVCLHAHWAYIILPEFTAVVEF